MTPVGNASYGFRILSGNATCFENSDAMCNDASDNDGDGWNNCEDSDCDCATNCGGDGC